jgi:hypothetical protein
MNGDNIFDTKTGETYEEHSIRIRDEKIRTLEAERAKLVEVLRLGRLQENIMQEQGTGKDWGPVYYKFLDAMKACANIKIEGEL